MSETSDSSSRTYRTLDPSTGELVKTFDETPPAAVEAALEAAVEAQERWRSKPLEERCQPIRTLAEELKGRADAHSELMALEMGKPLGEGRSEAEKCAWLCEHMAEHAPGYLADEPVETEAARSLVSHRPLGVVLAIMPWNFPYWQIFRCAVPAMLAGNAVLLKHAPNVPQCADAIAELMAACGLPEGLFANLRLSNDATGELIDQNTVRGVALTGSAQAGRKVAERAGAALKKTVLELGGSDPYLVLDDADPAEAAELCAQSRMINSGQSCIAAKRFLVLPQVREAFEEALVAAMARRVMGDPRDEDTTLGPMARDDLRRNLHRQVADSREAGARCLLGGEMPAGDGYFYPATVLTDVRRGMPAFHEEVFGPVAAIVPVADEAEAIAAANATRYGLGAAVFTADRERGLRLAREELEAGACFVNDFVRSDPRMPFGGVKDSGWGRELARYGMLEFTNTKSIWVAG